jgi:hypothetical protein
MVQTLCYSKSRTTTTTPATGFPAGSCQLDPPDYQPGDLADAAMASMESAFERQGHDPSDTMKDALRDALDNMEAQANGLAEAGTIYLSALDCGVGKTSAVRHFLAALVASATHDHVSVLVCVGRLDQLADAVDEIVEAASLLPHEWAILTSDKALNARTTTPPGEARILFTSHAMVEHRCRGHRSFKTVDAFHYRGQPRAVKLWDESAVPGKPITIPWTTIGGLAHLFARRFKPLSRALEALAMDIVRRPEGDIVEVPDFEEAHGVDLNAAYGAAWSEADREDIDNLWALRGRHVTIRHQYKTTVLDFRDTLPADIGPLLVLDASGRVRTLYQRWEQDRGGLRRLKQAVKSFAPMELFVMDRGGGKEAFNVGPKRDALLAAIAQTIRSRPDEPWLVVHHKVDNDVGDIPADLSALVPDADMSFVPWGAHDSTNRYKHIANVILAGTLFLPNSAYEAHARLGSNHPSSAGPYPGDKVKEVKLGEHAHRIIQAVCRGAARQCVGDSCPPCRTYVIAAPNSGIKALLPAIFRGASVSTWEAPSKAVRGKAEVAVEFVKAALAADPEAVVSFSVAGKHVGLDPSNFSKLVRKNRAFQASLRELGVHEWGPGRRKTEFRRMFSALPN